MECKIPNAIDMNQQASWCPGCGHGIIVRILAEAAQELGIDDRMLTVDDVACGEFAQFALKYNSIMSAHGRAIIAAAGLKRVRPDDIVVARPGDGSAYSIGIESTLHCALRNENILALVINNSVFGMTGGQMSPTSIVGMKTTSSPHGRDIKKNGSPIDITKILGNLDIAYLARGSVDSPANVMKTERMIKKALQKQMNGEGFCLVEVLSPCPTNWHLTPVAALDFVKNKLSAAYPLGEFVDKRGAV
jgi:2-oxoglutarate ferredoxin oxidoreductase subunit beta